MSERPIPLCPDPLGNVLGAEFLTNALENPLYRELTSVEPVVTWILPNFIPRGTLIALAGLPGAGKSYLCYTMGFAIATGLPILGFTPTRPHRVLYFDQENSRPDRVQYQRYAYNGLGKPDLTTLCNNFWGQPFVLGSDKWVTHAKNAIETYQPELIFIDTATPSCNIQDENNNAEAAVVIEKLRRLQVTISPTATMVVLKHAKLRANDSGEGFYTMRGAKAWEGQVDAVIFHIKGEGRPRKDGLNNTRLHPSKTRAFGLREPILIEPSWTDEAHTGISLHRRAPSAAVS